MLNFDTLKAGDRVQAVYPLTPFAIRKGIKVGEIYTIKEVITRSRMITLVEKNSAVAGGELIFITNYFILIEKPKVKTNFV